MLKSVIIPLEAEINQLKAQLKESKEKILELESLVIEQRKRTSNFIETNLFLFVLAARSEIQLFGFKRIGEFCFYLFV